MNTLKLTFKNNIQGVFFVIKELKTKQFWKTICKNSEYADFIDVLKKQYENNRVGVYESLKYSSRQKFYETGDRADFEKLYFQKREYLSAVAMLALIYEDNEEYLNELQDIIWNICDEPTWILPAHIDDDYDKLSTYIDLFSAETGFALSEICSLLGKRMNKNILIRTQKSIKERIIDVYLNYSFPWETADCNWGAVCGGAVGGVLIYNAPEIFEEQKDRLISTMNCFLMSYPSDGTCLEGHSYWLYGFGYYCLFADLTYRYSHGEINLMQGKKIKNIACYMQRNFLKGNSTVSFSDGTREGRTNIDIQYYLNKIFPDDVHILPKEVMKYDGVNINWHSYLRGILYYNPTLKSNYNDNSNYYLQDAGQFIANREKYSFVIKAGNNDEPHNHNDIGSFIISDSSGQVFCDLGAGKYTKDYFTEHRYEYLCTSSLGHSVPIVDGYPQKAGKEYSGSIVCLDNDTVSVELSKAYGIERLKCLTRTATLKENGILISDTIDSEELSVTERFITLLEPKIENDSVVVGNIILSYDSSKADLSIKVEKFETHSFEAEELPVYCIDFVLKNDVDKIDLLFEIK